jgi:acyl carrier protein
VNGITEEIRTITEEITEFLTAALRRPVGPEDDYFALGLADSLFALELVTHVEDRYAITVEVEDLDLDSFRTAARLAHFVGRKSGANGPAAGQSTESHEQGA